MKETTINAARNDNIMIPPYSRAPHAKGAPLGHTDAPNAALLIDFDNVTMGMRSDLSKELKNLLNSDIIKGKVTVQRAYADWRRYPQYIVPLSENSVDLIFAPAYGSSKKNATDIRMAIDAIELVFIRPEIGTFILLTGDSDFSSLVLKLKEYGKYVIGVGIQESSSDILVQNCDEYYSYTSLTGLRKTTDSANKPVDPWILVETAVERMSSRDDVMRSDRLKQVMVEIDPSFDEGNFGFSKFSKFITEAAGRNLLKLKKLDNGQYEVSPTAPGKGQDTRERVGSPRKTDGRERSRDREPDGGARGEKPREGKEAQAPRESKVAPDSREKSGRGVEEGAAKKKDERGPSGAAEEGDPLKTAYALLTQALKELTAGGEASARDSDLKRKMLEIRPEFDEGELGFGKFSRFLRQAHDHEVVDLQKREEGTYQVAFRREVVMESAAPPSPTDKGAEARGPAPEGRSRGIEGGETVRPPGEKTPSGTGSVAAGTQPLGRLGSRRHRSHAPDGGPPPLLEGQVIPSSKGAPPSTESPEEEGGGEVPVGATARTPRGRRDERRSGDQEEIPLEWAPPPGEPVDPVALGLPTDPPAVIRYLTNSYKGVGQKTAESLVEAFGDDLYRVMSQEPQRIAETVAPRRAEQLLKAWSTDLARRLGRQGSEESRPPAPEAAPPASRRRTRRGGRGRGRDDRKGGGESGSGPESGS